MTLTRDTRRWLVAGIIAAIGWGIAIPIIVLAPPDEDDPLALQKASKPYAAGIERIGGKSAVMGAELNEFLASLFQGARLGYTIGISSLIAALLYRRLTRAPDADRGARADDGL